MTQTPSAIETFLLGIPPFEKLSLVKLQQLCKRLEVRRYRMGQAILPLQELPPDVAIIYTGQARLIGHDPQSNIPVTLQRLQPGEIVGWKSLLRGVPCEKVMACDEETLCLVLPHQEFLTLLAEEPALKAYFMESTVVNSKDSKVTPPTTSPPHRPTKKYPHIRESSRNATLACLQMVSQYFGMPFRREVIRKAIANNQKDSTKPASLQLCGAIADFMGLKAQLVSVPAKAMNRLPTPALIHWQDSMAVIYETSDAKVVLGVPEGGIVRQKMAEFL
ncbi:cysteine peptidase family C39 domain-containing protein, partial [Fischerella thermalis]